MTPPSFRGAESFPRNQPRDLSGLASGPRTYDLAHMLVSWSNCCKLGQTGHTVLIDMWPAVAVEPSACFARSLAVIGGTAAVPLNAVLSASELRFRALLRTDRLYRTPSKAMHLP